MSHLVPIMIRTFGRTGSTLLMQILGTGKQMCMERHYPFEQRYLTYVHNMSRMISDSPRADSDWNNDVLFRSRSPFIGCLPYGRVDAFDKNVLADRCFLSLWTEFSIAMRETQGIALDTPALYAEKTPNEAAVRVNKLLKAKNLFLLRDPRDEMVSIRSFNEKRGFKSFGWLEGDTDISYARKICKNRRKFLQNFISFEGNERRMFVRYEDLILDGRNQTDRLSRWLEQPLSFKQATSDKQIKKKHMTSGTPSASVGRWKKELTSDVLQIFSRELGTELSELGYTV